MKFSTRLSDATHILVLVEQSADSPMSSKQIAESVRTNPSYVRTLMAKLKAADLITASRGSASAALARPANKITLCDIYRAVEGNKPLLHLDTHVSHECSYGVFIQLAIQDAYDKVQASAEREMGKITLASIVKKFKDMAEESVERTGSIEAAVCAAIETLSVGREPWTHVTRARSSGLQGL